MGLIKEFREFALKGSVIDLAVGVIIGAAFGLLVKSLVDDVLMPPIGYVMGGVDFSDKVLVLKEAGPHPITGKETPRVVLSYGKFINVIINFLIVAFCIFIMVKVINTARKKFEKQQAAAPESAPADVQLLGEIRDILKAQSK